MAKILVVDDMQFCREPIVEALRMHGHTALSASGGHEALMLIGREQPDLMLLDLNMPKMDGHAVLRTIRKNPDFRELPVILLTEHSDKEHIIELAKSGIQGYVLKSTFKFEELLSRIDSCLQPKNTSTTSTKAETKSKRLTSTPNSTGTASNTGTAVLAASRPESTSRPLEIDQSIKGDLVQTPTLIGDSLLTQISKDLDLRPLSATVQDVMAVSSSAGCSADDVARAAGKDQALCIRLLRLAHSSAYSRGKPVANVKEAIQRIGIQEVRNLIMSLEVLDMFGSSEQGFFDYSLFWEHSLACGLLARSIAKASGLKSTDDFFSWGILHDVGRIILISQLKDEYQIVCDFAREKDQPLERAEKALLKLDHCDVLAKALEQWRFSRDFIVPVTSHHMTEQQLGRLAAKHREPAMAVALANRMAHALLAGNSGNETIYSIGTLIDTMHLPHDAVDEIARAVPEELRELKVSMLSRANAENWTSYAERLKSRLTTEVRPYIHIAPHSLHTGRYLWSRLFEEVDATPPNLIICHVASSSEWSHSLGEIARAAFAGGAIAAPLLVITSDPEPVTQYEKPENCEIRVLSEPVSISTVLCTILDLLGRA